MGSDYISSRWLLSFYFTVVASVGLSSSVVFGGEEMVSDLVCLKDVDSAAANAVVG